MNKKYYIYKFLGEDNKVLYVGQTTNLKNRMYQHFIAYEKEKFIKETEKIEYKEYNYKNQMCVYEIYYINKLKPKYNDIFNLNEPIDYIKECTKEWINFDFSYLLKYTNKKTQITEDKNKNNGVQVYYKLPYSLFTDSKFKNFRGIDFLLMSLFIINRNKGWVDRKNIANIIDKSASENTLDSSLKLLLKEKIIIIDKKKEFNKCQSYCYKFNMGKIHIKNSFNINTKAIEYSLNKKITLSDFKTYLFLSRENNTTNYKYNDVERVMGKLGNFPINIKNLNNIGLIKAVKNKDEKNGLTRNIYNLT